MTQEKDMGGQNHETDQADDVATLYSWANLHGAKYRDFSSSRQEMRVQMRQRALAEQAKLAREEALQQPAPIEEEPAWEDRLPQALSLDDERSSENGLQRRRAPEDFPSEPRQEQSSMRPSSESRAGAGAGAAPGGTPRQETSSPRSESAAPGHEPAMRHSSEARVQPAAGGSHVSASRYALPVREQELSTAQRTSGMRAPEAPAASAGPAWLAEKKSSAPQVAPAESLQQSRERVASRWFALQGIFGREREEMVSHGGDSRPSALSVFSLAGGVGKSTLVATLGRALAARGERVLLADTSPFGLLPFYFGAREVKPGVVRTFSGAPSDPPIRVLTLDTEHESADGDLLKRELARATQDVGRILIDVATASANMMRQALRMSSVVVVPIVPDMASVATLQSLENLFRNPEGPGNRTLQPWYLLNQFDPSLPLHLDLREVLRQRLGDHLLPFAVHRSTACSEALAEGMTVIDYAPNSPAVEDFMNLVTWVRSASVATAAGHRGARWSER